MASAASQQSAANTQALVRQNEQLWRLIERQRSIIFQLRERLESTLQKSGAAKTSETQTLLAEAKQQDITLDLLKDFNRYGRKDDDNASLRSGISVSATSNDIKKTLLSDNASQHNISTSEELSLTGSVESLSTDKQLPQNPRSLTMPTSSAASPNKSKSVLPRSDSATGQNLPRRVASASGLSDPPPTSSSTTFISLNRGRSDSSVADRPPVITSTNRSQHFPPPPNQPPSQTKTPTQAQLAHMRSMPHLMLLPVCAHQIRQISGGKDILVFVISVRMRSNNKDANDRNESEPYQELWYCEKTFAEFAELELSLRLHLKSIPQNSRPTKLPDKSLFSDTKADHQIQARLDILDTFMRQLLTMVTEYPLPPILSYILDFISSHLCPSPYITPPPASTPKAEPTKSKSTINQPSQATHAPSEESAVSRLFKKASNTTTISPYTREKMTNFLGDKLGIRNMSKKQVNPVKPVSGPVFGVPLEVAVATAHTDAAPYLPAVIYRCITHLDANNARAEEGIYRLSGSSATIRALREKFNQEGDYDLIGSGEYFDPHAIAGLLKMYLRDMPDSVLTSILHQSFLSVMDLPTHAERISQLTNLVGALPEVNYALLRVLVAHFVSIISNSDTNKMTVQNIGIVFAPTLGVPAGIFGLMVTDFDVIFDREGAAAAAAASKAAVAEQEQEQREHDLKVQEQQRQQQRQQETNSTANTPVSPTVEATLKLAARRARRATMIMGGSSSIDDLTTRVVDSTINEPVPQLSSNQAKDMTTSVNDHTQSGYRDHIEDIMTDYHHGTENHQQVNTPIQSASDSSTNYASHTKFISSSGDPHPVKTIFAQRGRSQSAVTTTKESEKQKHNKEQGVSDQSPVYLNYDANTEALDYMVYLDSSTELGGKLLAPKNQLLALQAGLLATNPSSSTVISTVPSSATRDTAVTQLYLSRSARKNRGSMLYEGSGSHSHPSLEQSDKLNSSDSQQRNATSSRKLLDSPQNSEDFSLVSLSKLSLPWQASSSSSSSSTLPASTTGSSVTPNIPIKPEKLTAAQDALISDLLMSDKASLTRELIAMDPVQLAALQEMILQRVAAPKKS